MYAGAVIGILLAEVLYLRAVHVLGARGYDVPFWQQVAWHGGIALTAIGLLSPIDGLAEDLLSAHMAQHLLIADLAAPLLLVGMRSPVYAFFLPRPGARRGRPPAAAAEGVPHAAPAARRDPGLRPDPLRLALRVHVRGGARERTRARAPALVVRLRGRAGLVGAARPEAPPAARRAVEDRAPPRRASRRDVPRDGVRDHALARLRRVRRPRARARPDRRSGTSSSPAG